MNTKIRNHVIVKNDTWEIGRFTVVQVVDHEGVRAVGISRKSSLDSHNDQGINIARGRAERALTLKRQNKTVNHPYMG